MRKIARCFRCFFGDRIQCRKLIDGTCVRIHSHVLDTGITGINISTGIVFYILDSLGHRTNGVKIVAVTRTLARSRSVTVAVALALASALAFTSGWEGKSLPTILHVVTERNERILSLS